MSALHDTEDPPPNVPVHVVRDESEAPQAFGARERPSLSDPVLRRLGQIESYMAKAAEREERFMSVVEELFDDMGDMMKHQTARSIEYAAPDLEPNGLRDLSVLVVEREGDLARQAEAALRNLGCTPRVARSRSEALRLLNEAGSFDVALVELRLPHRQDGIDLCRDLLAAYPAMAIIILGRRLSHPELDSLRVARLRLPFTFPALYERLHEVASIRDTVKPPPFAGSDERTTPSAQLPITDRQTPDAKRASE